MELSEDQKENIIWYRGMAQRPASFSLYKPELICKYSLDIPLIQLITFPVNRLFYTDLNKIS